MAYAIVMASSNSANQSPFVREAVASPRLMYSAMGVQAELLAELLAIAAPPPPLTTRCMHAPHELELPHGVLSRTARKYRSASGRAMMAAWSCVSGYQERQGRLG
eukprot:CAMPEP_0181184610 /NCGR_PEP_ID=MMETSP1096-20121128/9060_1 /TAXON_ID=156174 ORGANISM="Chrysochromulina ericina, Strain CCMP281" /NCGR_SAMPLE_ID=MMETSP1096 /ASSEMBLY_ACC=CAM_ASM_000453 /LENGTH=104 /DNA_ID=CAMNT_0023273387 /DNA_START=581 /DNA_END=896 /DNA_ORIENTATION=-